MFVLRKPELIIMNALLSNGVNAAAMMTNKDIAHTMTRRYMESIIALEKLSDDEAILRHIICLEY